MTSGTLERSISTRGLVGHVTKQSVSVPVGEDGTASSVVTALPATSGDQVTAGGVVLEVSGRPVFAIPGSFPLYRDLLPGMSGPDVAQLQRALSAAGHPLTADGVFGKGTEAAVCALYRAAQYRPTVKPLESTEHGGVADPPPDGIENAQSAGPTETIVVPRSEFIVAAALPSRVSGLPAVGSLITESTALGFESGDIVVHAEVPTSAAAGLSAGLRSTVTGPDNSTVAATITAVGGATEHPPSTDEKKDAEPAAPSGSQVVVAPENGQGFPPAWLGRDLLVTIHVELVADTSFLVPSKAVVTEGGGAASVRRREKDGSFTQIGVREVAALDGRSAVEPITANTLKVGDVVRVG